MTFFIDDNNDGELNSNESVVAIGDEVNGNVYYTMRQDGHLDISLGADAILQKVEIVSDHEASYEIIDNITCRFTGSGHLTDKTISMQDITMTVGNASEKALVTSCDFTRDGNSEFAHGAYIVDGNGKRKVTTLTNGIPTAGTYYTFVPKTNGKLSIRGTRCVVDASGI